MKNPRALLGGIAVLSAAALAIAWVSQHVYGMQPCPWCILQRVFFSALLIVALGGWMLLPRRFALVASCLLGAALSVAGAASAAWQHFVAASQVSCNLTFADKIMAFLRWEEVWPGMFSATASCADAAVRLAGLPYEFWSFALFVTLLLGWFRVWATPAPKSTAS